MARSDEVITVGDDWRSWPPSTWGSRDRAQAQLESQRETGTMPVVAPLPQLANGWFRPKPRRRVDARSRAIDELLENLDIR